MSATPLVVLAGGTVTTWDSLNESNDTLTFSPQNGRPLADVAWNHNGQVIATCSALPTDQEIHNNIVLSSAVTGSSLDSFQHNERWKPPAGAATSLSFGGKSRYLCIGDRSGAVCLWDLKKKVRVRQFFHDGQPSLQVLLDPTDTYILSLGSQAFRTYKLREGVPAASWSPIGNYNFSTCSISSLEPSIAAIGTDEGSLLLFDITNHQKSIPFYSFNRRHRGSITGVAFSPTNNKLLASTSEDGILQFFDKESGTLVEQLPRVTSGISAFSLNSDGISCAVGTMAGQVLLYDLRQSESVVASLQVHDSVKRVRFSPPPKNKDSSTPATLSKVIQSNTDRKQIEDLRRDLIRATDPHSLPVNQRNAIPQQKAWEPPVSSAGTFASTQPHMSTQSSFASEDPHNAYLGPIDSNHVSRGIKQVSPNNLFPPRNEPSDYGMEKAAHASDNVTSYEASAKEPVNDIQASPRNATQQAAPRNATQSNRQVEGESRVVPTSQVACTSTSSPPFTLDDVRDVVRDEVEKLQDDLEESLRNLHMDMIRQFHLQSQELNNALTAQLAAMDQLREENQKLREENEFLKRNHNQNAKHDQKRQGNGMMLNS